MTIDERTRHEMHLGLKELERSVVGALTAQLPPLGWADVATTSRSWMSGWTSGSPRWAERIELRFQRPDEHIDARIRAEIDRLLLFLFPTLLSGLGLAALIGKVVCDPGRLAPFGARTA